MASSRASVICLGHFIMAMYCCNYLEKYLLSFMLFRSFLSDVTRYFSRYENIFLIITGYQMIQFLEVSFLWQVYSIKLWESFRTQNQHTALRQTHHFNTDCTKRGNNRQINWCKIFICGTNVTFLCCMYLILLNLHRANICNLIALAFLYNSVLGSKLFQYLKILSKWFSRQFLVLFAY